MLRITSGTDASIAISIAHVETCCYLIITGILCAVLVDLTSHVYAIII